MSADAWIVTGLIAWGLLLIVLIAGMLKAAKDQDRQIDESNSRYQGSAERETDVERLR